MVRLGWGGVMGVFGGLGSEGKGLTLYSRVLVLAVLQDRNNTQPYTNECKTDVGIMYLYCFMVDNAVCSARMVVLASRCMAADDRLPT